MILILFLSLFLLPGHEVISSMQSTDDFLITFYILLPWIRRYEKKGSKIYFSLSIRCWGPVD